MKTFIDWKMQQLKDGTFDLVIENGGIALDQTLETSIAASLFTDSYSGEVNFGQRRGGMGIYFGNTAWTRLLHSKINDEETIAAVNREYNETLKNDFLDNNVWETNNIELYYAFNTIYINVDSQNSSNNQNKFSYNYKISGVKNG